MTAHWARAATSCCSSCRTDHRWVNRKLRVVNGHVVARDASESAARQSCAATAQPRAGVFFVLAYGVSWLLWMPAVFSGLPAINPTTQAPSLYVLPGIAIGVTGSAFLMEVA